MAMDYDDDLEIVIDVDGEEESTRRLRRVDSAVSRLGKTVKGMALPLLGGGLLVGILGGSLLGLALSSGSASNALYRVRDSITQLLNTALAPILPHLYKFLEWFDQLSPKQQILALLGVTALFALGPIKGLVAAVAGLGGTTIAAAAVMAAGVALLGIELYDLIMGTNKFEELWSEVWNRLPTPVQSVLNKIGVAFDDVMQEKFIDPLNTVVDALNLLIRGINSVSSGINAIAFTNIPAIPLLDKYVGKKLTDYFPEPGTPPVVPQPFHVGTAPWVLSSPNPNLATAQGTSAAGMPFQMGDTNIYFTLDGQAIDHRVLKMAQLDPNYAAALRGVTP